MSDKVVSLTAQGQQRLQAELDSLRNERRPAVVERLQIAREDSEAWDNPEVQEAKDELAFVDGRIQELERTLADAEIIEEGAKGVVSLGSTVTVVGEGEDEDGEEEVYQIVGSAEAMPAEGRISDESPVGSALLGKKVRQKVKVQTPSGTRTLVIRKIE